MDTDNPLTRSAPPPRRDLVGAFFENSFLLLLIVFLAWCLEIVDYFLGNSLDSFGIRPRVPESLMGIATAHWLHGGFGHILSNTIPFVMLGGFVLLGGRMMFWKVSTFVAAMGGGLLWLLGGGGNHLGASLMIFGYLGFLLTRGFFERSALWVSISVITLFFYGGMVFGVLPGQKGVSWEGHLFGFIAGVVAARLLVPSRETIYRIKDGRAG